jgi:DNA-binding PadR family transcriptional regulator
MEIEEMATATNTTPCVDLSAFQRDLLAVLACDGPVYGLGIVRSLEVEGYTDVKHPRVYVNLDDLVEMGLVEKSERDKRTNEYALTTDGKGELRVYQNWLTNCLEANDV